MTLDEIRYFGTPEGQALLQEAVQSQDNEIRLLERLRKAYPHEMCRAAVGLAELRERAKGKFSRAEDMVFDREGLEQASGEVIARHRARRYAGFGRIADLCCGIGGDTTALSAVGDVVAVDHDPARVAMARWNASVYAAPHRVRGVVGDVTDWVPGAEALYTDPSRRHGDRRVSSIHSYLPPVQLARFLGTTPHVGLKVAPGIPYPEIPTDCEVEFISESGACKEAVLWFGSLRTPASRRATLLPSGKTLVLRPVPEAPVGPPGAFMYEPDRAVIRAHLIDQVAEDLGAWKLDPEVAYLSSDCPVDTPFARSYPVTDVFPFSLNRLQAYLDSEEIGRLDIKKRRFPVSPDELRPRLKVKGDGTAVIFLTRIGGRLMVVASAPASTPEPD